MNRCLTQSARLGLVAALTSIAAGCDVLEPRHDYHDHHLFPNFYEGYGYCPEGECRELSESEAMAIRDAIRRIRNQCGMLADDLLTAYDHGRILAQPGIYFQGHWGRYYYNTTNPMMRGWVTLAPITIWDSWALDRTLRHEIRHEQLGPGSEGPASDAETMCPSLGGGVS
jgi:hypothetical protein